jgi:hypothetical protein
MSWIIDELSLNRVICESGSKFSSCSNSTIKTGRVWVEFWAARWAAQIVFNDCARPFVSLMSVLIRSTCSISLSSLPIWSRNSATKHHLSNALVLYLNLIVAPFSHLCLNLAVAPSFPSKLINYSSKIKSWFPLLPTLSLSCQMKNWVR